MCFSQAFFFDFAVYGNHKYPKYLGWEFNHGYCGLTHTNTINFFLAIALVTCNKEDGYAYRVSILRPFLLINFHSSWLIFSDMFALPNKKAMEVVMHFLFTRLHPQLAYEEFRYWPVLCSSVTFHLKIWF